MSPEKSPGLEPPLLENLFAQNLPDCLVFQIPSVPALKRSVFPKSFDLTAFLQNKRKQRPFIQETRFLGCVFEKQKYFEIRYVWRAHLLPEASAPLFMRLFIPAVLKWIGVDTIRRRALLHVVGAPACL